MQQQTCCGRMDALDTPGVDSELVATYFEGHLIDNQHYTFGSQPADSATQHSHSEQKQWKHVQPFVQHVYPTMKAMLRASSASLSSSTAHDSMQCDGGSTKTTQHTALTRPQWPSTLLMPPPPPSAVTRLLHTSRYVFMRWKEQYFLCGADGRLSINGVYLVAFDRLTGDIDGIYWDEHTQTRRSGKKRWQQIRLQRVPDALRDGRISTHSLH